MAKKSSGRFRSLKPNVRAGLIFAGIIAVIFGWLLWNGFLSIEKLFAILLFIAGISKIVWGLFAK